MATADIKTGAIELLHRDMESWIGFGRKCEPWTGKDGKVHAYTNLASIPRAELNEWLPGLIEELAEDSYFTVNGYHRAAFWKNRITGLPDAAKKESNLRRLNACYADIDSGRPEEASAKDMPAVGWPYHRVLGEVVRLAEAGILPVPSIVAKSGRGVYVFWRLVDPADPAQAPRTPPQRLAGILATYKAVNRALVRRLHDYGLPADKVAIDGARVLRMEGSVHRSANVRVEYAELKTEHGSTAYTLEELAAFLGVPYGEFPAEVAEVAKVGHTARHQAKNPGSAPGRKAGRDRLLAGRAADLWALHVFRGGFAKRGTIYPDGWRSPGRGYLLALYAGWLKGCGTSEAATIKAVQDMAAGCRPAWPDDPRDPPIGRLVRDAKAKNYGDGKLCELLAVTPDLVQEVGLDLIVPPKLKETRKAQALEQRAAERAARGGLTPKQAEIRDRREWLRDYIEQRGIVDMTPLRTMQLGQDPACPFEWRNRETARADLNAIGHVTNNRKPGGGKA